MESDGEVDLLQLTATDVADEFSRAGKILVRRFDELLGGDRVSTPRSRVLAEILRLEPVRVSAVAASVGVAQGTASVLVDALAKEGLVHRVTDPSDRRATLISLTAEGRKSTEAWQRDYDAAAVKLFAALPQQDWPHLVAMLRKLSGTSPD
jgi:DNA-binding MarR family transcriptional regulator